MKSSSSVLVVIGFMLVAVSSTIGHMLVYGQPQTLTTTATLSTTASKNNDTYVVTGTELKNNLWIGIGQSNLTKLDIFKNGSGIAIFTTDNQPISGMKLLFNHSFTPEGGFPWADNGTVFDSEGRRVEFILN